MIDDLEDLLSRTEDLHPALAAYLIKGECGSHIRHPLVFSSAHTDQFNALVNYRLRDKLAALAQVKQAADWETYIWLHERPYRV
jgi:hypothetical protein